MAIRKKGRSRFFYLGREFSWYVHKELELRIASTDKKFVVAVNLSAPYEIRVSGEDFPREQHKERPLTMEYSGELGDSMGKAAANIVEWAFGPSVGAT